MAVPATALDVLSVASLKAELRLEPDDDTTLDAQLEGYVKAAVEHIERYCERPILRTTDKQVVRAGTTTGPIHFWCPDGYQIVSVKYWPDKASLRLDPSETISVVSLGRRVWATRHPWWHSVWPSEDGWPESEDAYDCRFELSVYRGVDIAKAESLRHAVILAARELWEGQSVIQGSRAMYTLADPYRHRS